MKNKRIILVEDDLDHADLIIDIFELKVNESNIILIRDGQEAIDYFQEMALKWKIVPKEIITLILLDLNLPKISGMNVLKYLKKSSGYSQVPVVILSTSSDKKTIDEAYKNGVDRFVTKPVSYDEFIEKLETLKEYC